MHVNVKNTVLLILYTRKLSRKVRGSALCKVARKVAKAVLSVLYTMAIYYFQSSSVCTVTKRDMFFFFFLQAHECREEIVEKGYLRMVVMQIWHWDPTLCINSKGIFRQLENKNCYVYSAATEPDEALNKLNFISNVVLKLVITIYVVFQCVLARKLHVMLVKYGVIFCRCIYSLSQPLIFLTFFISRFFLLMHIHKVSFL